MSLRMCDETEGEEIEIGVPAPGATPEGEPWTLPAWEPERAPVAPEREREAVPA